MKQKLIVGGTLLGVVATVAAAYLVLSRREESRREFNRGLVKSGMGETALLDAARLSGGWAELADVEV